MIPQTKAVDITPNWQQELANAIHDPAELLNRLGLNHHTEVLTAAQTRSFPLRVTQSYLSKMRFADITDPLLRQVLPLTDETLPAEGFLTDPVGDNAAIKSAGILQKYHGRALLLMTGACAIHCRYCFRRHFPYSESNPLASQWSQTCAAIAEDDTLTEIIMSGGDPLVINDRKLIQIVSDLEQIPHLKRLRIHTRLPLVLPKRITPGLLDLLRTTRLKVVMVIHANHGNEIDLQTATALGQLREAGCELLNQAVLLRGVNDNAKSLVELSERLSDAQVMPYYLHLLDKVAGAQHFDVTEQEGIAFIQQMRTKLPGYLVPRLVREIAGEPNKTIIA
ncbi:Lysyl-lysine 2,3-aminomutase [Methylophaga frappieri]|uniref:L-lysine 2,3-aminomutase n=1 Tax=Methylophaga frappieri (strain ATCC BAA-2434 / DSM 25690 / JAM7) TaxID=754477 RepID=I1YHC3_METFJ|nr:EF-P beta-lysylation protein EpmB [Methylophaga frappieri]AFJ02316.1 Lysyl-lysine 2,3-aminomutase [Methylophaga frappieri]